MKSINFNLIDQSKKPRISVPMPAVSAPPPHPETPATGAAPEANAPKRPDTHN